MASLDKISTVELDGDIMVGPIIYLPYFIYKDKELMSEYLESDTDDTSY